MHETHHLTFNGGRSCRRFFSTVRRDRPWTPPWIFPGELQFIRQAVDSNFAELYSALERTTYVATLIPFASAIPLNAIARMPTQSVAGSLTFSAAAGAIAGGSTSVILIADGVHTLNFSAFSLQAGSWVGTAGTPNLVNFWTPDGSTLYCSIFQGSAIGQDGIGSIAPSFASASVPHGVNPTLTIATGGSSLNTAVVPPANAFSISSPGNVAITGVAVAAHAIALSLTGTVNAGDSVTIGYSPWLPTTGRLQKSTNAQDAAGNQLGAFSGVPVTVS